MARSAKSKKSAGKFEVSLDVAVVRPKFEVLESVRYLDAAKLERAARAEVEVGFVRTDCCRKIVRAVIRKGKVTALTLEEDSDEKGSRASPELALLLNEVERKAPKGPGRGPRLPVPVAVFLKNPGLFGGDSIRCWQVCYQNTCVICCQSEQTGMWLCSADGFIVKSRT